MQMRFIAKITLWLERCAFSLFWFFQLMEGVLSCKIPFSYKLCLSVSLFIGASVSPLVGLLVGPLVMHSSKTANSSIFFKQVRSNKDASEDRD